MKKLILIKNNQIAIHYDYQSLYCDFCGTSKTPTFTSSFDDRSDGDNRKCEMQICFSCVEQLYKLKNNNNKL